MEVRIINDGSGRRDRSYRPFIQGENTVRNLYVYDPNGMQYLEGLYQGGWPTVQPWVPHVQQFKEERGNPAFVNLPNPLCWRC